MRILLDTHILFWWLADDPELSDRGREAIAMPENLIAFSAASIWEIRIKHAIGKLDLPDDFANVLARQPFEALAVTVAHAHALQELPLLHRDPFDRLLVAQARLEGLTILTRDNVITQYDVPRCWPDRVSTRHARRLANQLVAEVGASRMVSDSGPPRGQTPRRGVGTRSPSAVIASRFMWMLVHRNAKTRLVAGGRSFLEVCPECGRKVRFDEVEITRSYGVFFIDLLDDKERKYRCSACHEVFDLRDEPDGATSARADEARQAERTAGATSARADEARQAERTAAEARRAAEADRLRERARAQAIQAKAAQDRAAQAKAAQARAARIEDELAELKKRMGR